MVVASERSIRAPARDRALGGRRRDIQGMRAIAVLAVIAYHADLPVHRGYLGVDVFFVISGFVITGTLLPELGQRNAVSALAFYGRRARRLLPALALMIAVTCLAGVFLAPADAVHAMSRTGVAAALFTANIHLYNASTDYFAVDSRENPLLHTWSLGVEEQFYLLFPLVLLAGWWLLGRARPERRRAALAALIALLSVVSLVLAYRTANGNAILGHQLAAPASFAFYSLPTRVWELGLGALLCVLGGWINVHSQRWAIALRAVGLVAVAYGIDRGTLSSRPSLIPVLGAGLVMIAGTIHDDERVLGHRALVWIGDRSYSWYLWHLPFMVFAAALWADEKGYLAVAALLSLAAAAASYRWVENPIRRNPRLRGPRIAAMAAGCIAVGVTCALIAPPITNAVFPDSSWRDAAKPHVDAQHGCNAPAPIAQRPPACTWSHPGDRARAVLIGDSNAGHFSEAVVAASARERVRLTIATLSSCPFAAIEWHITGLDKRASDCRKFFTESRSQIEQSKPQLVIIAALSTGYVEDPTVTIRPLAGGAFATTAPAKARVWRDGVKSVVDDLTRRGIHVLLVHQIPEFPSWPVGGCANVRAWLKKCEDVSVSLASEVARRKRVFDAEQAALAGTRDAYGLSLDRYLCNAGRCSRADAAGRLLYVNALHLSPQGAERLTEPFTHAIARALRNPQP